MATDTDNECMNIETITMYRPTGPLELKLVADSGYKRWPPRLPGQPIFYPVTNEQYAIDISSDWNVRDDGIGYVTKFEVKREFVDRYNIEKVGGADHTEWWIPAEDLDELNSNIVGIIEIVGQCTEKGKLEPFSGEIRITT